MRAHGKHITSTSDLVTSTSSASALSSRTEPRSSRTDLSSEFPVIDPNICYKLCALFHMKITCWKELETGGACVPVEDGFTKTVQKAN